MVVTAELVVAALAIEDVDAQVAWEIGDNARIDVAPSVYVAIQNGRACVHRQVLDHLNHGVARLPHLSHLGPIVSDLAARLLRAAAAANRVVAQ